MTPRTAEAVDAAFAATLRRESWRLLEEGGLGLDPDLRDRLAASIRALSVLLNGHDYDVRNVKPGRLWPDYLGGKPGLRGVVRGQSAPARIPAFETQLSAALASLIRVGPPGSMRNGRSARSVMAAWNPDTHSGDDVETRTDRVSFKHQVKTRSRNPDAETVDFLAEGGWHIEKAGATGNPRGRQSTGASDTGWIRLRLERHLGGGLDDAKAALRRGRPTFERARRRQQLAEAVAEAFGVVNGAALAAVLECSTSTVYKLRDEGDAIFGKKSPKGGEDGSAYWAFRNWTPAGCERIDGRRAHLFSPPLLKEDRERRAA